MEVLIRYEYRVPEGASHSRNTTYITSETLKDRDLNEVESHYPVGKIIWLEAEDTDVFGEGPREYVVLEHQPVLKSIGEPDVSSATLYVIVTDRDA